MKVKLYGSPTCFNCLQAKKFLEENEVDFQEINVAGDEQAAKEMVEKTGQTEVPVIQVGEEMVIGFDQSKLEELLHL